MKSFYEILEVPESATTEQIRSAYLKLAREYHPDRVPEHLTKLRADAEDKFKLIQQAWAVLGDQAKRGQYDRLGGTRGSAVHPRGQETAKQPQSPQPGSREDDEGIQSLLQRKHEFVTWSLIVLIATLLLVVIGEFVVSRQSKATSVLERASEPIIVTVPADSDKFNLPPRHIQTWRSAGGGGLNVKLVGVANRANELELTFRVAAGDHGGLLLYEPPGASSQPKRILGKNVVVDHDFGELYIEDDTGAKYVSSSGFVGGQQTNFNLYNFTRRINFKPHEEVVLFARFPAISQVSSITFVSPALGKWQPEWRWPNIPLK